jgi:hypothetical protein
MAKEYLEQLTKLIEALELEADTVHEIAVKHFFSGAALYVNGKICASLSPVGLALKLSEAEANQHISTGNAIPLKYFPKGKIKKDYVLFEAPDFTRPKDWQRLFITAIHLEDETLNSNQE